MNDTRDDTCDWESILSKRIFDFLRTHTTHSGRVRSGLAPEVLCPMGYFSTDDFLVIQQRNQYIDSCEPSSTLRNSTQRSLAWYVHANNLKVQSPEAPKGSDHGNVGSFASLNYSRIDWPAVTQTTKHGASLQLDSFAHNIFGPLMVMAGSKWIVVESIHSTTHFRFAKHGHAQGSKLTNHHHLGTITQKDKE